MSTAAGAIHSKRGLPATKSSVTRWTKIDGNNADGEKLGRLLEDTLDASRSKLMFRGVGEAVMNSCEHAYPAASADGIGDGEARWWAFACEEKGNFYVTIADLGAGIPATLPQRFPEAVKALVEHLRSATVGVRLRDGDLIHAAVELGRTRTGRNNRGKGLFDMRRSVDDAAEGSLFIYSNSGRYEFRKRPSGDVTERSVTYGSAIRGTLISWCVPLLRSAE